MSYDTQRAGDGARRKSPSPLTTQSRSGPSSDNAAFSGGGTATSSSSAAKPLLQQAQVEKERLDRVSELVKRMGEKVAQIQKQTMRLGAPNAIAIAEGIRAEVQDAQRMAADFEASAKAELESIPAEAKGLTQQERSYRNQSLHKVKVNLESASRQLEVVNKEYEQAELRIRKQAPNKGSHMGTVAATGRAVVSRLAQGKAHARRTGVDDDPNTVELGEGGGVGGGRFQEMDVHEAEVEIHGHIINEFASDVTTLEEDVRDLNQCMRQLAQITAEQGQNLESIESHMSNAVDNAEGAHEQIDQASQHQRTGNKRLWYILLVAIVLMIILIMVLVFTNK